MDILTKALKVVSAIFKCKVTKNKSANYKGNNYFMPDKKLYKLKTSMKALKVVSHLLLNFSVIVLLLKISVNNFFRKTDLLPFFTFFPFISGSLSTTYKFNWYYTGITKRTVSCLILAIHIKDVSLRNCLICICLCVVTVF